MHSILKHAQLNHYALGAFNFSTAEILKAIVAAAREAAAPIIVATSEGEAQFIGMREAVALVGAWRQAAKLPIILNLDHGKNPELIKKAIAAGYNAVHCDYSSLPYEENILKTRQMVDFVLQIKKTFDREIIVEGELGYLRGSSSLHQEKLEINPDDLTSPQQAADFIARTGVDSLAVVIGNAHGIFTNSEEKLNLERLARIKEAVAEKVYLVLHGGSGISGEDIKKAVELGIVKINVNTELRLAYKEGLNKELSEQPNESTPYKILEPSFEAVKAVVAEKIKMFGSAGKV